MKSWHKWAIGGASALSLVLVAVWLRKRKPARAISGPQGDAFSGYTFDVNARILAAAQQIGLAQKGRPLTDARQAEDFSEALVAPAYDAEAWANVAYLLAVGARLTGQPTLLSKARAAYKKAVEIYAIPGSSTMTSKVANIYRGGADALRPYASDKQVASLIAIFSSAGSAPAVTTRQAQESFSPAREAATASSDDVTDLLSRASLWVRDIVGLDRPGGLPAPIWRKWLGRGVLILAVGLTARVVFAPEYHALKAAGSRMLQPLRGGMKMLSGPSGASDVA